MVEMRSERIIVVGMGRVIWRENHRNFGSEAGDSLEWIRGRQSTSLYTPTEPHVTFIVTAVLVSRRCMYYWFEFKGSVASI